MPVIIHEVKGYDEHQNLLNSLHDKIVYCWYVGAKGPSGESWCGDCRDFMVVHIHIANSYNEHNSYIQKLQDNLVICWYTGSKGSNGESWCQDSREAEPIINDYLKSLKTENNEVHVIYTEIEKDYFRSKDCDFRNDPKIKLEKVPTLFSPKNCKTLVEADCKEKSLLDLFFEDLKNDLK